MALLGQQHAQHHLALGDEQSLASDQVLFPDVAVIGYAWVIRIVDRNDVGQRIRPSGRARGGNILLSRPAKR